MLFSKKQDKKESEETGPIRAVKPETNLRLEKYWDEFRAAESYRLVEYYHINGQPRVWFIRATGDKDWANRTSKHFDLKIEPEPLAEEY